MYNHHFMLIFIMLQEVVGILYLGGGYKILKWIDNNVRNMLHDMNIRTNKFYEFEREGKLHRF